MEVNFNPVFTIKQTKAIKALRKTGPIEVLYGGAKGGGKSHLGVVWMYDEAVMDIKRHKIGPQQHPICLGFMGRMVGKDFNDTTLETWKRVIPEDGYEIKGNPPEIIIGKRVKYLTGGLDRREVINKFNSAEYARAFIDQAEETDKDKILLLRTATHNRLIINGKKVAGKILWTANPRQCWLKSEFVDSTKPHRIFIPALPDDNPYLGEEYKETLRETFEDRPDLLKAYLEGDWEILAGVEQVIQYAWIKEAQTKIIVGAARRPRLVCDTARFGNDETVIYYMETTDVEEEEIMPHCRTTQISQRLAEMSYQHNNCPVVVESTGADLGAGVADELNAQGKTVVIYTPQGKSSNPDKYFNQRTEAWCITAKRFVRGEIQLSNATKKINMQKLIDQLCQPTYKFRGKKTIIERKEDIKERLGCSPDRGDTFVIGQWSYERVPVTKEDTFEEEESTELADSYSVKSVL